MRERQKEAEKMYHGREKQARDMIGYTAWSEKNEEERQKKSSKDKAFGLTKTEEDLQKLREERELRKEERRALTVRQDELFEMKKRWEEEDKRRSKARSEDENYRRDQEWSRRERQLGVLKRERQQWREDRSLREEERAVREHIRNRSWQMKQDQESFDVREWAKVQERRKGEKDRALIRAALSHLPSDGADPYTEQLYRETERRKKNWDGYKKRLNDSEDQFDELKKWYTERSLERAERTRGVVFDGKKW
eukprot:TRINITY_DN2498_c0_g1_i2.p1 TRINITY_DN2498_c0_g1~~TRINITY_DN2498_c0_g1_i2.p1  ORF type:complete len:251 (-),score=67.48 TRINITY_DN2498_c0_g1_i2:48-800(-)